MKTNGYNPVKAMNLKAGQHILHANMYRYIKSVYINSTDGKVVIELKGSNKMLYLDLNAICFVM